METLSSFTRETNLTPTEKECAKLVKRTLKLVEDGLLTGREGAMRIWGAREILMANDAGSPIWLDMMQIENELIKQ